MSSVEHGMYRSIIMTGRGRTAGKSREVSKPKEKLRSGNTISVWKKRLTWIWLSGNLCRHTQGIWNRSWSTILGWQRSISYAQNCYRTLRIRKCAIFVQKILSSGRMSRFPIVMKRESGGNAFLDERGISEIHWSSKRQAIFLSSISDFILVWLACWRTFSTHATRYRFWKQGHSDNKHLSVLNFEKQERQKEVAELEQTISGSKEELSSILHQQIAAGQEIEQIRKEGEAIRQEVSELFATNLLLKEQTEELTEDKEKLLFENEKLEKQQKKL